MSSHWKADLEGNHHFLICYMHILDHPIIQLKQAFFIHGCFNFQVYYTSKTISEKWWFCPQIFQNCPAIGVGTNPQQIGIEYTKRSQTSRDKMQGKSWNQSSKEMVVRRKLLNHLSTSARMLVVISQMVKITFVSPLWSWDDFISKPTIFPSNHLLAHWLSRIKKDVYEIISTKTGKAIISGNLQLIHIIWGLGT